MQVRTWRYKPFELNNEPTEIATTIMSFSASIDNLP